jgi:hypothetical protein
MTADVAAVRRFYADYFIGHQAQDMRLELVSRTATVDRVVDEMIVSFTHDVEIPWVLPRVARTGPSPGPSRLSRSRRRRTRPSQCAPHRGASRSTQPPRRRGRAELSVKV